MSEPEAQLHCTGSRELLSAKLAVVDRSIGELKPDAANPRLHSKKQIRQIASSIEAFGFNVPILIDRDDKLIAGHGRLLAARELGWSEVPTLCLDHLTPAQARAFMITDNRLSVRLRIG
jgi:ParB-like chromosome segregation protein Spo0J